MAKNKIKHLLVIRLSAMGDVAMTVPVLLALTQMYPEVRIIYLTKPFFLPIVSDIPNVTVIAADVKGKHKGVLGLWKLFQELKNDGIDAVADLHNVLRSNILGVFFKLYGIPLMKLDKGRREKKELTSGKHDITPLEPMYERYKDVFGGLGFNFPLTKHHVFAKKTLPSEFVKTWFSNSTKRIGIAPFAAFPGKIYPLNFMEDLIGKLCERAEAKILLFGGGKKEAEILQGWQDNYPNCLSVAGSLSFSEELKLISNLDVMVSMDSGNGHLAAMYGIPVITLWGVTHPYAGFTPFGQDDSHQITADRTLYPLIPTSVYGKNFPPGYEKVMETIPPDQVYNKVVKCL